ncbi:MAG: hypothetical protein ISR57_01485 [Bacteroidales bacterium]|nr:hypothetical protein [Bacteroidota bacterium]MBL6949292.1 hypothetical protein [Bacteroidales bacterium]
MKKPTTFLKNLWDPLLLGLIFFLVFVIAILPYEWHDVLYSVAYTLLFITCTMTLGKHRWKFLFLVLAAISMEWISTIYSLTILETISVLLNFLFFAFMTGFFIHQVAVAKQVTVKVIISAIIGYLLLGLIFSILVGVLAQINSGMFNVSPAAGDNIGGNFSEYLYYGFVTLTTLGYGDIVPLQASSRSLSILISVTGQLYLAIIIALLVGKYASQRTSHTK